MSNETLYRWVNREDFSESGKKLISDLKNTFIETKLLQPISIPADISKAIEDEADRLYEHPHSDYATETLWKTWKAGANFLAPIIAAKDEEIKRLKEALNNIISPIAYLQKEADKSGALLNGMAIQVANDANFLQSIAREALK